jgi:NAD(P)H-dependent FMN reductase
VAAPETPGTVLVLTTSPQRESMSTWGCSVVAAELSSRGATILSVTAPVVAAGLDDDKYGDDVGGLLRDAADATAIVLGVPVHRSGVSGFSRNTAELLRGPISRKPVLVVAAAGSMRGHLAAHYFRGDLSLNFGANVTDVVVLSPDQDAVDLRGRLCSAATNLFAVVSAAESTLTGGAR